MSTLTNKSYIFHQLFVVSGVLSTILSCGLGLGYLTLFLDHLKDNDDSDYADKQSRQYIELAGELAFVPSIVVIPFTMQRKGRRIAFMAATIPLLLSWIISFEVHFTSQVIFNILHNVSMGGAATLSSIIIGEYCSPQYRGTFLMLETAMISLGYLLSHVLGALNYFHMISTLGVLTAIYSFVVVHFYPESPYWLISQGQMGKCAESFEWLRGQDQEAFKELESMCNKYRLTRQLQSLGPVKELSLKEVVMSYAKTPLKADFLRPLTIMILILSFVGFGGENIASGYSLRNLFQLANGKYIGTLVLDVMSLVCSLTACLLIQIVQRKTLFIFTASCSIIFLSLTTVLVFLQSLELLHKDLMWVLLTLVTGFVMFMSLGTAALPFSLLGEIFPMSYKGIGSSLTCAYLWAFGNTMLTIVPSLTEVIGTEGILLLTVIFMILILFVLKVIMPETSGKSILEIEELMRTNKKTDGDYDSDSCNGSDHLDAFERLKLFVDVC